MFKTKKSEELFKAAQEFLVGGVNSPVRAFKAVGGTPLFIQKAEGAYIWDADGNRYVDFVSSWGPMILGHARPEIIEQARAACLNGTSFGATTELEIELARRVIQAVPSMEKVRFVSSGTEAVMGAIRLARGFTGREKIVKFSGCYHGHSDAMLVKAGSGAATLGVPDSKGIPKSVSQNTIVLPYNNLDLVKECFNYFGAEIAALIVEPVAGNMGLVTPQDGFLRGLREIAAKNKSLLIFDEVITGFRAGLGGAQGVFGISPDLTCLGKIIGGGFPVGAFGGKNEVMMELAPEGAVYQAGTLSGNPVAMAAGIANIDLLMKLNPWEKLAESAAQIKDVIIKNTKSYKVPVRVNQFASMFTVFFADQPVTDYDSAKKSDTKRYGEFFHHLLGAGLYFPPAQFECAFLSVTHTDAIIEKSAAGIVKALKAVTGK